MGFLDDRVAEPRVEFAAEPGFFFTSLVLAENSATGGLQLQKHS